MRIFYDTEFVELGPGKPISFVSIGMVKDNGAEYYAVALPPQEAHAELRHNPWLRDNVLEHLPTNAGGFIDSSHPDVKPLDVIRDEVSAFCFAGLKGEEKAELWAYYADYDHVVLSQLFGRMIDLPAHMPMYTRDIKQAADHFVVKLPPQEGVEHHALADARWVRRAWEAIDWALVDSENFWIDR